MHETVITILIAVLTSSSMATVLQIVVTHHYAKKDKVVEDFETMKKAMAAITHDAYFRQARYVLGKDEISEAELENHNYLYKAYHSQGLNGTGDRLHELILEKPVIPHEGDAHG